MAAIAFYSRPDAPDSPDIVDVTGVTIPQTSPATFAGATFSPNLPANGDVIYVLTDGSVWTYNGTNYVASTGTGRDFWRSGAGTVLPDGVTDIADNISRTGKVGVGNIQGNNPVAQIDIANGARSGTDGRTALMAGYVTGSLPAVGANTITTPVGGFEVRHSNQTSGIGVAYDGLYATGNITNQSFHLRNKGNGIFSKTWEALSSGLCFNDNYSPTTAAINQGFICRYYTGTLNIANIYPAYIETLTPLNVRAQWNITSNNVEVTGMRLHPDMAEVGNTTLWVGEQRSHNRKIVLWDSLATSAHQFFGFGINSATLRVQINATTSRVAFFAGTGPTASNEVLVINGSGRTDFAGTGVNTSGIRMLQLTNTSPSVAGKAIGVNATGDVVPIGVLQKFRTVQNLPSSNTTITHNLGLTSPFAVMVEIRTSSGSLVATSVTGEATNSVVINTSSAVSNARITIIG